MQHTNDTLFLFFQVTLTASRELVLVRCLVQIGVTLVARNSIFKRCCSTHRGAARCSVQQNTAQAKYKLYLTLRAKGPRGQGAPVPLYLLNLQLRNSIMKDRRFFFLLFFSFLFSSSSTIDPSTRMQRSAARRCANNRLARSLARRFWDFASEQTFTKGRVVEAVG